MNGWNDYNCDLKYAPSDGQSVTWYEPTPIKTTSDTKAVLPPGIEQVYEGSPVTLNWNYSLQSSLGFAVIKFNGDGIVTIKEDGSANDFSKELQERFSLSSTLGKASLSISPITVTDDGEFSCELFDSNNDIWKRAIEVQVIGKLESAADFKKGVS